MICAYVTILDIKNLRLVNRHYHSCASLFLFHSLKIASNQRSLSQWKSVCENSIFNRGVSKVVYQIRLEEPILNPSRGAQNATLHSDSTTPVRSAVRQCYDVYNALRVGLQCLPRLKNITIRDTTASSCAHSTDTCYEIDSSGTTAVMDVIDHGRLNLLILLRSLAECNIPLEVFSILVQNLIPGSTISSWDYHQSKNQQCSLLTMFERCLEIAMVVLANILELNIITRGPDLEGADDNASLFIKSLEALIQTAGPRMTKLQIIVKDMPLPHDSLGASLFTTSLFSTSPVRWPTLGSIF